MATELSAREVEVVECWAEGMTSLETAAYLGITYSTAKTHASRILAKLQARTKAQAVAIYLGYESRQAY